MKKGLVVVVFVLVVLLLFFRGGMAINNKKTETLRVEFEGEEEKEKQQIYTTPGFTAPASTKIKNKGNVEGYVFIEVRVPVLRCEDVVVEKNVKIKDGYIGVMQYEVEKPWKLVEEEIRDGVLRQVYCYGDNKKTIPRTRVRKREDK